MIKNMTYLLFIAFALGFSACEKVIDVELKDAEPKLVVEGEISDADDVQQIKLSETIPFGESTNTKALGENAVVYVAYHNNLQEFKQVGNSAVYQAKFKGEPGTAYTLNIKYKGVDYSAVSIMPQKVKLDSVSISDLTFFNEEKKFVKLYYQDTPEIANAYRVVLSINNEIVKQFFVENDRFNDGKYVNNTIYHREPDIETGDDIDLDFQNIDENVYRYFFAVSQISGNGGPPVAPSNPPSNISNGALGYFSAHTSTKRNFKVNN